MRWKMFALLLALAATACGEDTSPDGTPLERSCRGERVLECDPHEYTAVRSASLTPARISPLELSSDGVVRVELEACELRPGPAEVQLFALIPREGALPDAGADGVRLVDLGLTLRDDGTRGDATANDGLIEQTVGNPFGREIPGDTEITLRFVPALPGCRGDVLEVPYLTGPRDDL